MRSFACDFGNSRCKLGIFESGQLIRFNSWDRSKESWHAELLNTLSSAVLRDDKGILSSVADVDSEMIEQIGRSYRLYSPKDFKLPFKSLYEPLELGNDRRSALAGAFYGYNGYSCLVISLGTALTCDYLSANGVHEGGSIAPGLGMRFKSLNTFTGRLPLVTAEEYSIWPEFSIGKSTKESLQVGVQSGMETELEGAIQKWLVRTPKNSRVLLAGGDAELFFNQLKSSIFASHLVLEPHLVLKGLNSILVSHV